MGKHLDKMQTSKKILAGSWAVFLTLLALCIFFKYRGDDISDLVQLTLGSAAELTAAHGFYYWKAKNENRSKHAMQLVRDLADQYGIDAAARIAEVVLKD